MTVSNTLTKNKLSTNGVTVDFPFGFYITEANQVKCLIVPLDGGAPYDYFNFTVAKEPDNDGGTLTTGDVLNNVELVIYRDTQLTQETDYVKGGRFPADSHEAALDKLTLQNQEQQEELDRTLKTGIDKVNPVVLDVEVDGLLQLNNNVIEASALTVDDAVSLHENTDFINEFVESNEDTAITPEGQQRTTLTGIASLAKDQRDGIASLAKDQRDELNLTFQNQLIYKRVGNISDSVGQQLQNADKLNAYQHPDDSSDWYAPIQSQSFPITIPADPSVSNEWVLVSVFQNNWGTLDSGTQITRRRGTATEHASFTGAVGEITVNTTNNSIHVHDGVTPGGIEIRYRDVERLASGGAIYYDVAGQDTYTLSLRAGNLGVTSYFDGMEVRFYLDAPNTTTATVDVIGLGVKDIKTSRGTALAGGELLGLVNLIYNKSEDYFEILSLGGGGGVPVFELKNADFTIEKNKGYSLSMGDDIVKTVTIPDGLREGEWFAIHTFGWTGNSHYFITTETEEWNVVSDVVTAESRKLRISQNATVYLQKIGGKWSVVDGIGEGQGDNKRITELESLVAELEQRVTVLENL